MTPVDLSYIHETPSKAQEHALENAITKTCLESIVQYMTEVADTMIANNIPTLNEPTIRAMIVGLQTKIPQ